MKRALIDKIVTLYFDGKYEIRKCDSGMNNLTQLIRHDNCDYVMRIYQNHADVEAVKVEQGVLNQIEGLLVPKVVKMKSGHTIARVDGRLAVMFDYLKGENLKLEHFEQYFEYGKLVGQLSKALKEVKLGEKSYLPYYELEKSYPNVEVNGIVQELLCEVSNLKDEFKRLPHQWIHGDINCSNMLMNEIGLPCSILDFEFATWDMRAMEVAICLSELLNEKDDRGLQLFCEGFKSEVKLTEEEILMMPWLIRLRRLDVVLHFINRQNLGIGDDKIKSQEFLKNQVASLTTQHQWLLKHSDILKTYLR